MEYLYIAMLLQEVGKDITEENIQKISAALDLEIDNNKVRLLISALSILTVNSQKKEKKASDSSTYKQLTDLQKRFETLQSSLTATNDRFSISESKQQLESAVHESEVIHKLPARYVYGIADKGVRESLGSIGIEGSEVYTIPCKDLCIIVHDCLREPYQSEDEEVVKKWLFTQQEVLDAVADKFGVVLPMSFDMIIEGKNESSPEEEVQSWLEKNYDDFYEKVTKLRNKQEYGVQVMLDTEILSQKLFETDEKLKVKKKEIDAKPQGIAYMEKELLKDMVKEKIEDTSNDYFKEFYGRLKKYTDDIVIGKTKKVGGTKQMIMNLSCLVSKDMVTELGKELEQIEKRDGVSVRFSGPWAPFSFVTPEKG